LGRFSRSPALLRYYVRVESRAPQVKRGRLLRFARNDSNLSSRTLGESDTLTPHALLGPRYFVLLRARFSALQL
jgi:hypothetical protein